MKWVADARNRIDEILSRIPADIAEASKETAIEFFCDELNRIPIPFVGGILSRTLRKSLRKKDPAGPDVDDVLQQLDTMQKSDGDFLQGLQAMGEDVDRLGVMIESVLTAVEETRSELVVPRMKISEPVYRPNYPVSDNELGFGLMNIGGGAVKVPEIHLKVEAWEPETGVVYTVPAAPPMFLHLKVCLSPARSDYPLLQLNDEPFRRFGARSEGAEDVCIQMSSTINARYAVRIHIPFRDLDSDEEKALVYPPLEEPPLLVSFPYAPGWCSDVTPTNMLDRKAVLSGIIATFQKIGAILQRREPSDDSGQIEGIEHELREAGFSMGLYGMIPVLNAFIPPVAQLLGKSHVPGASKIVLDLVDQALRHRDNRYGFEFSDEAIDALDSIIGGEQGADRVLRQVRESNAFNKVD